MGEIWLGAVGSLQIDIMSTLYTHVKGLLILKDHVCGIFGHEEHEVALKES